MVRGDVGVKSDWLCKLCRKGDGSPFFNFGFRLHCNNCHVAKGKCFLENAPVKSPSQRKQPAKEWPAQPKTKEPKGGRGKGKGGTISSETQLKEKLAKLVAENVQLQKKQR